MENSPLALVGDRFWRNPILSIKLSSAEIISSGVLPEKTLISKETIPLVIKASLSALNVMVFRYTRGKPYF